MLQRHRPHRHPAAAEALLQTARGKHRIRITDISKSGAKLVGGPALQRGEKLTLLLRGQEMTAVVRWSGRDRCGVSFEKALSDMLLNALGARGMVGSTPRWDPSGLREMR